MKAILLAGAVSLAVFSPAWAGDPSPQPSLCDTDSPACRSLAIGVAKLELSESIFRELDRQRGGSLLCPEDNPNCCPPRLMPYCAQIERRVVVDAQRQFHSSLVSQFDNPCLWTSYCDLLGEPGFFIDRPPFDPPRPPLDCPCGTEFDFRRGVCRPKPCTQRGFAVPCQLGCFLDDLIVASSDREPPPPRTPLQTHLRDTSVQLEAAKHLHAEMQQALEEVEKEIATLSSYKSRD